MARDLMHDIMEQVIEEVVVEDIRNRVPDEKLDEKLSQDNISRAYKNLIEKASDDSLETIENMMMKKFLKKGHVQIYFWQDRIKSGVRLLLLQMQCIYVF